MNAVPGLDLRQHVAVCRQRSLPLALLEPQPAVPQEAGQLPAPDGLRAGRDPLRIRLLRDVEVIAVIPPSWYAGLHGKGVQLVIGGVTDHVRPQTAARRPAWWVDPDRHSPAPSLRLTTLIDPPASVSRDGSQHIQPGRAARRPDCGQDSA